MFLVAITLWMMNVSCRYNLMDDECFLSLSRSFLLKAFCRIVPNSPSLPPPAKADIATAILTNVIEHLVLLLPPNKHAFTAKAVWADWVKQMP